MLNWRKFRDEKPSDLQCCLTKMKHGIIEGVFHEEDGRFLGYYWQDMEWNASEWVPIEEVT